MGGIAMRGDVKSRWVGIVVVGLMGLGVVSLRAAMQEGSQIGVDTHAKEDAIEEFAPLSTAETREFEELRKSLLAPEDGRLSREGEGSFNLLLGEPVRSLLKQEMPESERDKKLRLLLSQLPVAERPLIEGNVAWIRGDREGARIFWQSAMNEKWNNVTGDAILNLARSFQAEGFNRNAIQVHLMTLNRLNEKQLTLDEFSAQRDAYRELSDLYLDEGDLKNALKYLELSTGKGRPRSHCGFNSFNYQLMDERRIKLIEYSIRDGRKLPIKPLAMVRQTRFEEIRTEQGAVEDGGNSMRADQRSRETTSQVLKLMWLGVMSLRAAVKGDTEGGSQTRVVTHARENAIGEFVPLSAEESQEFEELLKNESDSDDGRLYRQGIRTFFLLGGNVQSQTDKGLSVDEIEKGLQSESQPLPEEKILVEGNLAWIKGDRAKAREIWEKVSQGNEEEATSCARLNLSRSYQAEGEIKKAIQAHLTTIKSLGDDDPADMENVDKSIACKELSDLYLEAGDLKSAIKYLDAYNKYRIHHWCGNCEQLDRESYRQRKKVLEYALRDGRKLIVKPLALTRTQIEELLVEEDGAN